MKQQAENYLHLLINAETLNELEGIRTAVRANDALSATAIPFAEVVEFVYRQRRAAVSVVTDPRAPRYTGTGGPAETPSRQTALDHSYRRPAGVPGVDPADADDPGDGDGGR